MKKINQTRKLSQAEKAQILEANARLLAKRDALYAMKARRRLKGRRSSIPIKSAGELTKELLKGIPIVCAKVEGQWVPVADLADEVEVISVTGRPGQRRIKLKIRRKGTGA